MLEGATPSRGGPADAVPGVGRADAVVDPRAAVNVAQLPCLPYVEHFSSSCAAEFGRSHVEKAGILITFTASIFSMSRSHGDGGAHGVCHAGNCNNQQVVKPQFVEVEPWTALAAYSWINTVNSFVKCSFQMKGSAPLIAPLTDEPPLICPAFAQSRNALQYCRRVPPEPAVIDIAFQ